MLDRRTDASWRCCTVTACAILLAAAAPASAQQRLTASQIAEDVALVEATLEHLHPGYTRFATDDALAQAWAAIVARARADGGLASAEFYLAVSRVLAEVRCNHTKAELPPALTESRRTTPTYLPLRWQFIGAPARAIIADPVAGTGLQRGDEILAIDGVDIATLIRRYAPFVPVDGFNDSARIDELAFSSEFPGGAIEHFGSLAEPPAETVELTVRGADGAARVLTVPRLTGDEWRAHLAASGGFYRNFRDAVTLRFPAAGVAYLDVGTFVNYRQPVDPAALYDPVFRALAARNVDTLIVDLRRNGGGSTDAQQGLFERLITEPTRLMRTVTAKAASFGPAAGHVGTWDSRAMAMAPDDYAALPDGDYRVNPAWVGTSLVELEPHPLGFRGSLIVLIDETLSSGSNHLVSRLADRPAMTLLGTPGGGNAAGATAGIIYMLTLPSSGIVVRVPAWRHYVDRPGLADDARVLPDVTVTQDIDDWRRGHDTQLAKALDLASR